MRTTQQLFTLLPQLLYRLGAHKVDTHRNRQPNVALLNVLFITYCLWWYTSETWTAAQSWFWFSLIALNSFSAMYHSLRYRPWLQFLDQSGIGIFVIMVPYPFVYKEIWSLYWFPLAICGWLYLKWTTRGTSPSLKRELQFLLLGASSLTMMIVWGIPNLTATYPAVEVWRLYLAVSAFAVIQVVYATCKLQTIPGYWGVAEWCHVKFIAPFYLVTSFVALYPL